MKKIADRRTFDSEIAAGDRLALFYSAYCPFCLAFLPEFERQAEASPGAFMKVCTDDLPELEDLFSVDVVPTALFFRGGRVAARLDGALGRGLGGAQLADFAAAWLGRGGKGK